MSYVAAGLVLGGAYVAFDVLSETRLEHGTLTGALASLHAVVDRVSPLLVGAMLGVLAHYVRLRKELARAEGTAARAEALRMRLLKVERDQAVWVLVAAVLHELNNPLHALGLLLDEQASEPDEAKRAALVERARAQADRARAQLAVLRTLRASAEPTVAAVALDPLVHSIADEVSSMAASEGVRVEAEVEPSLEAEGDANYVRTILENLVDNSLCAFRHHGVGGSITIRAKAEKGLAVVRVADDGPPIDGATRYNLFEPLSSANKQGLGLGLPIARALARAMRGDVALDETRGKAFLLELPLHTMTPAETAGGAG
jgi:signal transduction histidine kinase